MASRPRFSDAAAAVVGLACVFSPARGEAVPPGPLVLVRGTGRCPAEEPVRAEILRLTPADQRSRLEPPVRIGIDDVGESYTVSVFDGNVEYVRVYRDEGRHCEARARFSAVFAVLTLMPPDIGLSPDALTDGTADPIDPASDSAQAPSGDPEPHPRPPTPAARPPAPTRPVPGAPPKPTAPAPSGASLELAVVADHVPAVRGALPHSTYGLELGVSLPRWLGGWAPAAVVRQTSRASFDVAEREIGGDIMNRDLALGLRWVARRRGVVPRLSTLLVGRISQVRGRGLLEEEQSQLITPGVSVNAGLGLSWSRVTLPFTELRAALFPLPARVVAEPPGELGKTAVLELGVKVGAGWLP